MNDFIEFTTGKLLPGGGVALFAQSILLADGPFLVFGNLMRRLPFGRWKKWDRA